MREAGVTTVSVGIFSWALLEPSPGTYDFGWLDRLLDLLHDNGIRVDLGTPTVCPPAWSYRAHPDALPVTDTGVRYEFGSRGAICHSNAAHRAAAADITTRLAERYGDHPALELPTRSPSPRTTRWRTRSTPAASWSPAIRPPRRDSWRG